MFFDLKNWEKHRNTKKRFYWTCTYFTNFIYSVIYIKCIYIYNVNNHYYLSLFYINLIDIILVLINFSKLQIHSKKLNFRVQPLALKMEKEQWISHWLFCVELSLHYQYQMNFKCWMTNGWFKKIQLLNLYH